jgi:crossover junction endodeoxyribonuclease RusA
MNFDPVEFVRLNPTATLGKSVSEAMAEISANDEAVRKVKLSANKRTSITSKVFKCERFEMDGMTVLTMPFPPSINHYYQLVSRRSKKSGKPIAQMIIGERGVKYRQKIVRNLGGGKAFRGRLSVSIMAYPENHRGFDLDNLCKALLDSLAHAGIYENDGQIDKLCVERGSTMSERFVVVSIKELKAPNKTLF